MSLRTSTAKLQYPRGVGRRTCTRHFSSVQGTADRPHVSTQPHFNPFLHHLQVFNADTSLLFYSYSDEEVYQWAQAIEEAIHSLQRAFGSHMNSKKLGYSAKGEEGGGEGGGGGGGKGETVHNPLLQRQAQDYNQPPVSLA